MKTIERLLLAPMMKASALHAQIHDLMAKHSFSGSLGRNQLEITRKFLGLYIAHMVCAVSLVLMKGDVSLLQVMDKHNLW